MDRLYAPWRTEYVTREKSDCVFCDISLSVESDTKNYILYRDDLCFVVMNKYPYNPGHFMIIPHIHIDNIENLDKKIWLHMSELAQKSVKMLKEGFGANGVNIGINLGDASGAGISEHIHLHLVPRWHNDSNFITTIANTRVYSTDFESIYNRLKEMSKIYFA
jgi:diadenosine tetraphosphate (Ap4A) HIT family hydrolase